MYQTGDEAATPGSAGGNSPTTRGPSRPAGGAVGGVREELLSQVQEPAHWKRKRRVETGRGGRKTKRRDEGGAEVGKMETG